VVATLVLEGVLALEARGAAFEQGYAADAGFDVDAGELVDAAPGEAAGQLFLVAGQHMHGPVRGLQEHRQAGGGFGQTPEHQGRIQRHRVEAVGGQPDQAAVGGLGGDDGDAGGEGAQGLAEFGGVESAAHCGNLGSVTVLQGAHGAIPR
jgi:hypothetical protein